MNKPKSLKSGILAKLIVPLILIITADAILSYFITLHHVDHTYDSWLLDTARALGQEIKIKDNRVVVELPLAALEIVKWDDWDKTYFKITSTAQGLLAGDNFVPEPRGEHDWSGPVYFESSIAGDPVRIVSMRLNKEVSTDSFFIHVAETLNKRRQIMRDILLADLIPNIALVIISVFYLLIALKQGLKPLYRLADEISRRSPRDLSPVAETHVFPEVRTLTDTINGLLQRLAVTIATQQRFIANAAHQLRTPLAGFVIQAERAARESDIDLMRPAIYQMQISANRLSHTVNQLLVLAKSEAVEGRNELKPINLYALVREACLEWAPKAMQRHMELSFDSEVHELIILGDNYLLNELVANLLDNAINYGRDRGHIHIALTGNPTPTLIIADDGPGIPLSERHKIFERFYRIPGNTVNGCGLGLAIVKEIVELHHANLKLNQAHREGGTKIIIAFKPYSEIRSIMSPLIKR